MATEEARMRPKNLILSQSVATLVNNNIGVTIPTRILDLAARDKLFYYNGCITDLYYAQKGNELTNVSIDGVSLYPVPTNLKSFQERLEHAACCGMSVWFSVTTDDHEMWMFHAIPCGCPCHKGD